VLISRSQLDRISSNLAVLAFRLDRINSNLTALDLDLQMDRVNSQQQGGPQHPGAIDMPDSSSDFGMVPKVSEQQQQVKQPNAGGGGGLNPGNRTSGSSPVKPSSNNAKLAGIIVNLVRYAAIHEINKPQQGRSKKQKKGHVKPKAGSPGCSIM